MMRDIVRVEAMMPAPPSRVFDAFTAELDRWWRPDPRFRWLSRGGVLRFESGQLIERVGDEHVVIGQVLAWEPGSHLAFSWRAPGVTRRADTRVDIRFEAHPGGTRLVLEHSGWAALRKDHPARKGTGSTPALQGLWGLWWSELLGGLRRFVVD